MLVSMTRAPSEAPRRWRVAVTRDERDEDRLTSALERHGFEPVSCLVMVEGPPDSAEDLAAAARTIEQYDWVVCSSARAVRALARARSSPWPAGVRTAAVGARTAEAMTAIGAEPAPVVAAEPGADALWTLLSTLDTWKARRVLVPTVPGGRRVLIDQLRGAGAVVHEVEAYRMRPRARELIRADWIAARPDAVVIASPSSAEVLVQSVGAEALAGVEVVAIGPTTSAALSAMGVRHSVSPRADVEAAAGHLAALQSAKPGI
jgi:uroporphyrinogen-III synthase